MSALHSAFRKQNAIVGYYTNVLTHDLAESSHQRCPVVLLELVKSRAVENACEDHSYVYRLLRIDRKETSELPLIQKGLFPRTGPCLLGGSAQIGDHIPGHAQGFQFVGRQMIRDTRDGSMHDCASQIFRGYYLARRSLDQRWPTEEDRSVASHNDRLVRHAGYIGTSRRAATTHHSNLRDTLR